MRSALTLIELLVVVSVIALLASILTPTLSTVREAAAKTGCLGNIRQVGLAYGAYAGDNRGLFADRNEGSNFLQVHHEQMDPYLERSSRAWRCTRLLKLRPGDPNQGIFWYNWHIVNRDTAPRQGRPVHAAALARASETLVFADLSNGATGGWHRERSTMLMADLAAREHVDLSRKVYSLVITWMDPAMAVNGEYVMPKPSTSLVKGFSF